MGEHDVAVVRPVAGVIHAGDFGGVDGSAGFLPLPSGVAIEIGATAAAWRMAIKSETIFSVIVAARVGVGASEAGRGEGAV